MAPAGPSVLVLTKSCISKFEEAISLYGPEQLELENRLADFNLWADGVGALSKPGASLDSRLHGRANDLTLVKNVLNMLADCLDYAKEVFETKTSFDECIQNIDSVISNLTLIGVAIRRTGKASRNRRANRTFEPDEYQEFRAHLECIMLLRPTEAARFQRTENGACVAGLDSSKLSHLQNRLIDANLRRRHNFCVAQKRSKHQNEAHTDFSTLVDSSEVDNPFQREPPPNMQNVEDSQKPRRHVVSKNLNRSAPTLSGFSHASTAEGTLQATLAIRGHNPGAARTQITSIASDVEFPEPPPILSGRQVAKCPCCCQSLPVEIFTNPATWKQHIIEDLCPYTCVAENCPTPQLLFCTRSEWENHVKQSHLPKWQCPFCDEQDTDYLTMVNMMEHIQTEHEDEIPETSLSTILSWSAVQTMGITSCPLCASSGPEDSPDLVDHVLQHMYDFALRALPWPPPPVQCLNALPGSFNLSGNPDDVESIQHWINGAVHDEVEVPVLRLCHYDKADHSVPASTNRSDYSDHFLTNEYFNENPRDKSSRPQTGQSGTPTRSTQSSTDITFDPTLTDAGADDIYKSAESTLYRKLHTSLISCGHTTSSLPLSRFSFLPLDVIDKIITTDTFDILLSQYGRLSIDWDQHLITRTKKLFAILGLYESTTLIGDLLDEGIMDEHLPLSRLNGEVRCKSLVSHQGTTFQPLNWEIRDVDRFLRYQRFVLAPVINTLVEHVQVDEDAPLPFYNIHKSKYFDDVPSCVVYNGVLHAAHIKPKPSCRLEVFIKYYFKDTEIYEEKDNLVQIRSLKHPHLHQFITTIQHGAYFYAIFPQPDGGNLHDFWAGHPYSLEAPRPESVLRCLKQILGLVDAICSLHEMKCRSSVFIPEHILHFKSLKPAKVPYNDYGTLVFANNLGYNQRSLKDSRLCYAAPEALNDYETYDMWSMGCMLMDFLVWILSDFDYIAIDDFKDKRTIEDPVHGNGVYYYSPYFDEAVMVHPAVTEKLEALKGDPRYTKDTGLGVITHLIANSLLVIDPERRMAAEELRDKLGKVIGKAEEDANYLMNSNEASSPARSKSPTGAVDD